MSSKFHGAFAAVAVACMLVLAVPAMAQSGNGLPSAPSSNGESGTGSTSGTRSRIKSQNQLDLAAARAERKAIVGQNMYLSASEARVFWPLYDKYETQMDRIEDRHVRELKNYVENYDNLSNEDANRKLDEVMAIQQSRLDVQKVYIPKFRAVMSPIKVTRFFQIDNKMRAMVQCHIAQIVPLAQPSTDEDGNNGF